MMNSNVIISNKSVKMIEYGSNKKSSKNYKISYNRSNITTLKECPSSITGIIHRPVVFTVGVLGGDAGLAGATLIWLKDAGLRIASFKICLDFLTGRINGDLIFLVNFKGYPDVLDSRGDYC